MSTENITLSYIVSTYFADNSVKAWFTPHIFCVIAWHPNALFCSNLQCFSWHIVVQIKFQNVKKGNKIGITQLIHIWIWLRLDWDRLKGRGIQCKPLNDSLINIFKIIFQGSRLCGLATTHTVVTLILIPLLSYLYFLCDHKDANIGWGSPAIHN